MTITQPRGMVKNLGELHPVVAKLQKEWEDAQGKTKETLDELLDKWRARGYDEYVMSVSKGKMLLNVLQPWRYRIRVDMQSWNRSSDKPWYVETPKGLPRWRVSAKSRYGKVRYLFTAHWDISDWAYARRLWRRKK